jgi:hypothetical protein
MQKLKKFELPSSLHLILRTCITSLFLQPGTRTFMLYVCGSKINFSYIHIINLFQFNLNSTSNYYFTINLVLHIVEFRNTDKQPYLTSPFLCYTITPTVYKMDSSFIQMYEVCLESSLIADTIYCQVHVKAVFRCLLNHAHLQVSMV